MLRWLLCNGHLQQQAVGLHLCCRQPLARSRQPRGPSGRLIGKWSRPSGRESVPNFYTNDEQVPTSRSGPKACIAFGHTLARQVSLQVSSIASLMQAQTGRTGSRELVCTCAARGSPLPSSGCMCPTTPGQRIRSLQPVPRGLEQAICESGMEPYTTGVRFPPPAWASLHSSSPRWRGACSCG